MDPKEQLAKLRERCKKAGKRRGKNYRCCTASRHYKGIRVCYYPKGGYYRATGSNPRIYGGYRVFGRISAKKARQLLGSLR